MALFGTPELISLHLSLSRVDSLSLSSLVMSGLTTIGGVAADLLASTLETSSILTNFPKIRLGFS